jgi:HEAT repeat protein
MRVCTFVFLATTVIISGCRREERGPLLAGGREVGSWVADLNNPKPQVRRQAVLKLGNVGDADPAVVAALSSALRDTDAMVRGNAVHAVVKLTQPGEEMLARLREMNRTDPDSTVRDFAGKALAKLGRTE